MRMVEYDPTRHIYSLSVVSLLTRNSSVPREIETITNVIYGEKEDLKKNRVRENYKLEANDGEKVIEFYPGLPIWCYENEWKYLESFLEKHTDVIRWAVAMDEGKSSLYLLGTPVDEQL